MVKKAKAAGSAANTSKFNSSTEELVPVLKNCWQFLHDGETDVAAITAAAPEVDLDLVKELVQESLNTERPDTAFLELIGAEFKALLYAQDGTDEGLKKSIEVLEPQDVLYITAQANRGWLKPNPVVALMQEFIDTGALVVFRDRKSEAHIRYEGKVYSLSDSGGINAVTRLCLQFGQVGNFVTTLIQALKAKALDEAVIDVRIRSAVYKDNKFIINPSWESGQVIHVTKDCWEITDFPEDADFVFLSRDPEIFGLVKPEPGGKASMLQQFLNVESSDDIPLVGALIASCLLPYPPYPIIQFIGEGGTAKTTAAHLLVKLIDPSDLDAGISPPKESRALFVHAQKHHVVYLDNVTSLNAEQSADLSRLVQGAGHSERTNYTDKDASVFRTASPIILTAIDSPTTKSDLVNRSIVINFKYISETERRVKEDILKSWAGVAPQLLGLSLDGLVAVLKNRAEVIGSPLIKKKGLPRNADNAVALISMSKAFGWDEENMLDALLGNAQSEDRRIIEESPVAGRLISYLKYNSNLKFEGNHKELLEGLSAVYLQDLNALAQKSGGGTAQLPSDWPKGPRELSAQLKSVMPSLRKVHGLKKVNKDRRFFEFSLPKGALAETSAQPDDSNIVIADQQSF